MNLAFTKMTGAGNDFVMLDNRDGSRSLSKQQIEKLCDRHFGIGADGLLAVEPAENPDLAKFRMRYYNADGGEAEMCGNGARCFARYAARVAGTRGDGFSFETPAGIIQARLQGEEVTVNLTAPKGISLNQQIELSTGSVILHHCNTGVPHAMLFVEDVNDVDVKKLGAEIRFHPDFEPRGTNVNFVQRVDEGILVRTYERGVEDETLACGTGVTAAALVTHLLYGTPSPIAVHVHGGDWLEIGFHYIDQAFQDVTLKGPATFVFDGSVAI